MLITLVYLVVALIIALLIAGGVYLYTYLRGERPEDNDIPPHRGPRRQHPEEEDEEED